jgi:Ca2+-binding RTX toxin-like protein
VNVYGGSAHDVLLGGRCADVMVGYAGNDTLYGGGGNDQLYAGSGDDILIGGAGSDLLKGEGGADLFLFSIGDGRGAGDRILDFSEGDRIGFVRLSERTVSQALNADGNLEIYYGTLGSPTDASNRITLDGVHHLLAAKDFVFL